MPAQLSLGPQGGLVLGGQLPVGTGFRHPLTDWVQVEKALWGQNKHQTQSIS